MVEKLLRSGAKQTMKYLNSNLLTVFTISGILLGLGAGCILRTAKDDKWSQQERSYVKFGGEIFLQMLKALTLPLIVSSVIAALGSIDLRLSGKVGIRTLLYYLVTTMCAVILGVVLVCVIRPGGSNPNEKPTPATLTPREVLNSQVLMDMMRNMFPSNIVKATMYQYETIMDIPTPAEIEEKLRKNESIDSTFSKSGFAEQTNTLGLLVYSTIFGLALSSLGSLGKPVLQLFRCFSQLFMIISNWVLWLSPIGVACLLAGQILEVGDNLDFRKTGMFVFTALLGLLLHALVTLPVIYYLISGTHPFNLIGHVGHALLIAFGTSSSIATLPATVSCIEGKHGVDPRITRFVLPFGAAINLGGTAVFEVIAAIYLVQLHNIALDFGTLLAVSLVATIVCLGAAGIPRAGLVTMTMLTNILGLPATTIAFLIPIDWIFHRFRTVVNVLGDAMGASLVDRMYKDELGESQHSTQALVGEKDV